MMNLKFWIVFPLMISIHSFAQDTTLTYTLDSNFIFSVAWNSTHRIIYSPGCSAIYHYPQEEDSNCYKLHHNLIHQMPTEKNHKVYYDLACSLWNLEKMEEA